MTSSSSRGKTARVGALVAAALVVGARLKKKGKVEGPNESEMILLGYNTKFGPRISRVTHISWNERLRHGEQANRNFGIKLLLSQNWGACVYTKIWGRRMQEHKAYKIVSSRDRSGVNQGRLVLMQCQNRLFYR